MSQSPNRSAALAEALQAAEIAADAAQKGCRVGPNSISNGYLQLMMSAPDREVTISP
jgi:hypothetical protein